MCCEQIDEELSGCRQYFLANDLRNSASISWDFRGIGLSLSRWHMRYCWPDPHQHRTVFGADDCLTMQTILLSRAVSVDTPSFLAGRGPSPTCFPKLAHSFSIRRGKDGRLAMRLARDAWPRRRGRRRRRRALFAVPFGRSPGRNKLHSRAATKPYGVTSYRSSASLPSSYSLDNITRRRKSSHI